MLISHLAVTWMLVGLIWVMQLLVYPQFRRVGEEEFVGYHFAHCWRVGLIIAPLLAIEAFTAASLLYQGHREWAFAFSVVLIPVIWLLTAIVYAPMHTRLMMGRDPETLRRLIAANWLRTLAWTARGIWWPVWRGIAHPRPAHGRRRKELIRKGRAVQSRVRPDCAVGPNPFRRPPATKQRTTHP